jgi:tape measure domain-containing protein
VADLKKSIEIIFEGNDQASRKAADVLAKVRELEQSQKDASAAGDKLSKSLDDTSSKGPGIKLLTDAIKGIAAGLIIDKFIEANVEVQKFEQGLRAVKGTSADTGKELDYIRGLAERFGVQLGSLANTYTSLTAATVGTNLEGRRTAEIFESVVLAMSAAGRSSSETEGALRAIEQIAGKGKVQMEELRGQLGDRLPGALQIAARAMGTTTAGLEDLVKKGLSAEEFLPRFATELNRTFSNATFDGYTQQLARMRNAVDELFVAAGRAGVFDALTSAITGTTKIVDQAGVSFDFWKSVLSAGNRLMEGGTWDRFQSDIAAAKQQVIAWGAEYNKSVNETLAETNRLRAQGRNFNADDQSEAETKRLEALNTKLGEAKDQAADLDAVLKRLGVDPKKFKESVDDVAKQLVDLAENPAARGDQLLAGLEAGLKRVRSNGDISTIGEALTQAFTEGRISAENFQVVSEALAKTQQKLNKGGVDAGKGVDEQTKAMERAAKEAEKAQEKAAQFRLEMEKLASNERIKLIEARVTLDVTNIQENTKRIQAMLESVDNTVNSTGDLLKTLFGNLSEFGTLDWGARRLVEQQIEAENNRRQAALEIQRKITEAQIAYLNAQTRSIDRGDALIKVDGAGLQPHLEAFMWEILRTIQVRVNNDGLKLLLGV